LINTSRGAIVPIQPLADLLEGGFLGGVGLDVLEDAPPLKKNALTSQKYERLFGRNDVLLTPHVAGWSLESYERISKVLFDKIVALLVQPEI
jgi:D-3-phosphoglycerate dehydrogenase